MANIRTAYPLLAVSDDRIGEFRYKRRDRGAAEEELIKRIGMILEDKVGEQY